MRWNLSSRARLLSNGDATVLSIPKSGRTWVRVFISAYFSAEAGWPFSVDVTDRRSHGIPRIVYSHDRFEHLTKASAWERVRGKYLVPRDQLASAPVILLARDPRDAFVSYHAQLTRRNHPAPDAIKRLSADELLRHPRFGLRNMIAVMNSWVREFKNRKDFAIFRYEDLRADSGKSFGNLLRALGQDTINDNAFRHALQFSTFENMQQLEATGAFGNKILAPRDRDDRQSYKVRRGQVGGFADSLSPESLAFAARACSTLDPAFGYRAA
jgi:hypothetical protein